MITHAHPMPVASAVTRAFLTAWCVHRARGSLDPEALIADLDAAVGDLHDPGEPGTWPGAGAGPVRLLDRMREAASLHDVSPAQAFDHLFNGAFVLESLPAALWCFIHSPEDAEEVIVTAVKRRARRLWCHDDDRLNGLLSADEGRVQLRSHGVLTGSDGYGAVVSVTDHPSPCVSRDEVPEDAGRVELLERLGGFTLRGSQIDAAEG